MNCTRCGWEIDAEEPRVLTPGGGLLCPDCGLDAAEAGHVCECRASFWWGVLIGALISCLVWIALLCWGAA